MMKLLKALLLFFFILFSHQDRCDLTAARTYFFESETIGFGRGINESILSYGSTTIRCTEQIVRKGKLFNRFLVYIPTIEQRDPKEKKLEITKVEKVLGSFTTDDDGTVTHVYVSKKDNAFVQGLLKIIVSLLSISYKIQFYH